VERSTSAALNPVTACEKVAVNWIVDPGVGSICPAA
jgi:hypothetical protein